MNKSIIKIFITIIITLIFIGCAKVTSVDMVKLKPSSLQERQLQTRIFHTTNEKEILSSSIGTLQDLGFHIDEINSKLGVITASKTRDARETGQQIGLFILSILAGVNEMQFADTLQKIRATLVTTPKPEKGITEVRLTIMRIIYDAKGRVSKIEIIKDKPIYEKFFEALSKSKFLEEQKI
jgi:hypothetical protein